MMQTLLKIRDFFLIFREEHPKATSVILSIIGLVFIILTAVMLIPILNTDPTYLLPERILDSDELDVDILKPVSILSGHTYYLKMSFEGDSTANIQTTPFPVELTVCGNNLSIRLIDTDSLENGCYVEDVVITPNDVSQIEVEFEILDSAVANVSFDIEFNYLSTTDFQVPIDVSVNQLSRNIRLFISAITGTIASISFIFSILQLFAIRNTS